MQRRPNCIISIEQHLGFDCTQSVTKNAWALLQRIRPDLPSELNLNELDCFCYIRDNGISFPYCDCVVSGRFSPKNSGLSLKCVVASVTRFQNIVNVLTRNKQPLYLLVGCKRIVENHASCKWLLNAQVTVDHEGNG